MKRFLSLMVVTAMSVGILSGCGTSTKTTPSSAPASASASASQSSASTGNTKAIVMKVAFNQPETHPQYLAMQQFAKNIKEKTNGKYDIQISPNALLGDQKTTLQLTQAGTIDMAIVGGSLMESLNPDFVVFDLPYVFKDKEHQMKIVNDPAIVGDLYKSTEKDHVTVLGAFHGGVRNVYTKKGPINTPADLSGLKIRVMQSDTNVQMMSLMGGTGTPMGQGDVYTAIQSGVLDGGENNELIYSTLKHDEVAPFYSYTQHLMVPDYLIMNSEELKALPAEDQKLFNDEFQKAVATEVSDFQTQVDAAKAEAVKAGAKFNDVDTSVFRAKVAPLTEKLITTPTAKKLYQAIQDAQK